MRLTRLRLAFAVLTVAALTAAFLMWQSSHNDVSTTQSQKPASAPQKEDTFVSALDAFKSSDQTGKDSKAKSSQPSVQLLARPTLPRFNDWTQAYLKATPEERVTLLEEGKKLAEERRAEFKQLIVDDPRRAIAEAVPMVVRQQLPPEIVNLLEKRVNAVGVLRTFQAYPEEALPELEKNGVAVNLPTGSLTYRDAEMQTGETYRAYVYGRRAESTAWVPNASLNGVAMDTDFAVSESPSRTLEVGEAPAPATEKPAVTICPVSGEQSLDAEDIPEVITDNTPAVETATETVYFCQTIHIDTYNQTLIMGEGVTGGAFGFTGILPASPTPALGVVKVLIIPVTYADQNAVPSTEAALYAMLREVSDFYAKSSFGRLTLVGTVTPPVKLKHNESYYIARDTSNGGDINGATLTHTEARDEARKIGFDSNDYDCIGVRHNGGPQSYGGLGGGSSVWARSDSASLWAHEIGHCFTLSHANYWDTAGTSSIGAGSNNEYGDIFDNMGNGGFPSGQYNAQAKNQIKWMPQSYVESVAQSGIYRIYAMDQGTLDPSRKYAMTVLKDSQKTYWGEVRSLLDSSNPWVKNGMILGWRYPNGSGSNIQLLDTTPGSPFLKDDSPIALGSTFSDRESGIHLTTIAFNDTPRYIDVAVNLGQFAGNQRPVMTLATSAETVPTNAAVTFTATATDPDGDTLAYSWQDFGDTSIRAVYQNAPVITRTYSTAGTYIMTCTASDMKGNTTVQNKLITVGNGNSRYTISGRVTAQGVGLQDVVVTANGANGVVTDTNGYFTIANLVAGNYTLTPLLYGYSFTELFNNSITVGPSYSGATFEAEASPVVTIAASIPLASELSPVTTGQLRITRTGDISQSLTVNVNTASGSATKTTDYTISPDYVTGSQGFSTFTIPAGAADLDVTVTPVGDSTIEGPETAIYQLGVGSGYLIGAASSATVVINDDDTALPKVAIVATRANAPEGESNTAILTVSRTGSTLGALIVNYAVSGTATSLADYQVLTGTVTIPDGQSSAEILVTPQSDSISESIETVKVTLSTNASYFIDPLASNATANIYDDDTQTVTVVATDSVAAEVNLTAPNAEANTATFLVSRTGSTASPLTVYYAFTGASGMVMALHGVDFEAMPGSVTIPAGSSQATITILPRYDGLGEGTESVIIVLGAGATNYTLGTALTAQATITDNASDLPYVDVVNMGSASEPGTTANFRITVRGGSGTGTLPINFTMGGSATLTSDYTVTGTGNTSTGTSITLNNGAAVTKDVTITPVNDGAQEDIESVTLTLDSTSTYQTFAPTNAASMWLKDGSIPTVYVDAQVGTSGSSTFTEGATTTPVKFYVSRSGSTAASLTVNYAMSGTATHGDDYTSLPGSVTIPAGSIGADVVIAVTNDTIFEGGETIVLEPTAGPYSKGGNATMYITDNDTGTHNIGFAAPTSSGLESVATVNIPVNLSTASSSEVKVDYAVNSTNAGTNVSNSTRALPIWVRVVKTGDTITYFESNDGTIWTQRGTAATVTGLGTSYQAGLAVGSGSSTTSTVVTMDNFSVTGLDPGATTGTMAGVNIGNAGPSGSHTFSGGVYTVTSPGFGVGSGSTGDNIRFISMPVTNSANCTVTVRLLSQTVTTGSPRIGVMLRTTATASSAYAASLLNSIVGFLAYNRNTTGAAANSPATLNTVILPYWFRIVRAGDIFTTALSKDGVTWTNLGTAASQTLALGPKVLAGMTVSAASDGTLATATFDNFSITPAPTGSLQGRTLGFVNEQGFEGESGGLWTVTGSGNGLTTSNDEGHFVATEVTGDFTVRGRITSLTDGATGAQAGIMIREGREHYSRMMHAGFIKSGSFEQRYRLYTASNAFGSTVDYTLPAGTLTFAPGDLTKNITFDVVNDTIDEPNNVVTLQLTNANGAAITSTATYHSYTIVDDDEPPATPYAAFAASSTSVTENGGNASIQVSLSAPATSPVTVDYAVTGGTATGSGTDYTEVSGTLTFPAGETVQTITLPITDDAIIDAGETIILTLSSYNGVQKGTISTHTVTITDNDLPVMSIVANDPNAAEAGLNPGQFTVTRTGPTTAALTVSLARSGTATSGTDYTAIANPLSLIIPVGASSAVVNVTIPSNDSTNEGNETVILMMSLSPAYTIGTPSTATVTIADDDRSTVTIAATDSQASETPGNPGLFTITRSPPLTTPVSVSYTVSGTATSTTDYTSIGTIVTIPLNQSSITIPVTPVDDSETEGPEYVTVTLSSGSYTITGQAYENVVIADNDNAPVLFINSPASQGPLVASGNGIILSATITDDGAPAAVTQQWTQISGPGVAVIESPTSATTAFTFTQPGTYILRISATDTQFSVSDQVTVVVGSQLVAADWISQDLGPASARRGQSVSYNGLYTVTGTGAGYASTANDQAHVMVRQITGNGAITARLTSFVSGTGLSGLTIRDSMTRSINRAVLGVLPGGNLQFRARTTANANDAQIAAQTGLSLPLWLKLERNSSTGEIIASYAPDVSGSAGAWTQVGTTSPTFVDSSAQYGLTTTNNSTAGLTTALYDNVTLTPAQTGAALLAEDQGNNITTPGSSSVASGVYTVNGGNGFYHGWQYYGDMVVTARLVTFTSGAGSAAGGIRIAESMESGGYLHLGRMPQGAYNGYYWTNIAGGSAGGLPSSVNAGNWIRFIREGNRISAYRANDSGGTAGSWIQIGQPQTVIMTTPVWVGLYVNNNTGVGLNTCTFSNFTIAPLNKAPIVDSGTVAGTPTGSVALNGTVTDDNFPEPVSLTTLWSKLSGPGSLSFANSSAIDTTATFGNSGSFTLRLTADDGAAKSFEDLLFTGTGDPFTQWQDAQFTGGASNPAAGMTLDPDFDGVVNLFEYAFGTDPELSAPTNVVRDIAEENNERYLRLTVTKNPSATDVTYEVQATSDPSNPNSWTSVDLVVEANTATQLRVRDNIPLGPGRRFLRVKVSK